MMRLISVGVCALFLFGCGAEPADNGGNTPNANAPATSSAKFTLGKNI